MLEQKAPDRQEELNFTHQTADTSKSAFATVRNKSSDRKLRIENLLLMADRAGWTRHELADEMQIPLSSVCGLISVLKADGVVVEDGRTRQTPNGCQAKVIVLSRFISNR